MSSLRAALMGTALTALIWAPAQAATRFNVTNLVSDGAVPAAHVDPDLVNPWGLAAAPTGPWWTANNGIDTSTLYNGHGAKLPLTVAVPGGPTGLVFNGTGGFDVAPGDSPFFIYDTEGGKIAAWAPSLTTNTAVMVDNSGAGAVYKGLALATDAGGSHLYAANFHSGAVETYDTTYALEHPSGGFTDPTLAAGYAPFNVQLLDGELYVSYAKQGGGVDEMDGAGLGTVDVYDLQGHFLRRIASPGDELNAPWGMAIAPSSFHEFAGSLLVGNFGDGTISAFNRTTGDFLGRLQDAGGGDLKIDGLWSLQPGNDARAGSSQHIYFTAGINGEDDGLFGRIAAVPEAPTWVIMLAGFGLAGALFRRRRTSARLAAG